MSNTEVGVAAVTCDFCHAPYVPAIYKPLGTRRGMEVWVCNACGLTQSLSTVTPESKVRTLSTDADWGNVRHGKGVRFGHLRSVMEKHIDLDAVSAAMDVGANRGDFVLWMQQRNPHAKVLAIEPDGSVIDAYRQVSGIEVLVARLENVEISPSSQDLVFCSHTLEHASSAAHMLRQMYDALRVGGYLLMEVPNLEAISLPDIVEEYFIDKHPFHFDRETLIDYVVQTGFTVVSGLQDKDPLNLTLLLKKTSDLHDYVPSGGDDRACRNARWIKAYPQQLAENRQLLKRMVNEKLKPLGARQKVAYWGAGRIFDSLVKYGGLDAKDVYLLVDRFLSGIVAETHGVPIEKPEKIRLAEPHVIVILGNSAEHIMARQAYDMGVRHVVLFSELMGQVRDL